MSKTISVAIGIVMIVVIGGFTYWQVNNTRTQVENANTQNGTVAMTMVDVASHADASSCWSVINSNVYDLTSWIPQHPGGQQAILRLCGTDGSEKFNSQHGGSSMQENVLAGFNIGELSR